MLFFRKPCEQGVLSDLEGCEVQADQSAENAVMEVPPRCSPFRALVWKEWRQQRWIFLSLAGLAYALLLSAIIVDRYGFGFKYGRNDAAGVLAGSAFLIGVIGVVVLSANAFAGERDDNTDLFLDTIPCSRSKLFWLKLGLVLFLVLLALIPVGVAALVDTGQQPHVDFNKLAGECAQTVLVFAAGVLVLAIVPALIASFGGSVIATILASLPVVGACWAYMYSSVVLVRFLLPFGSREFWSMWAWMLALFIVLVLAMILLAAWRMWTRAERTWRSSLRTAAATAGLLIAYVAVPVAAAYLYVTLFAPLSFFVGNTAGIAANPVLAPNGKYVAFNTCYGGWGRMGSRVALIDMDSGRTRWLTRFRDSAMRPDTGRWSPSGNQFVLTEADVWLWPLSRQDAKPIYFVVDARSGEKRSFDELCPGLPQMPSKTQTSVSLYDGRIVQSQWFATSNFETSVGWYNEHVFAFRNERDTFFADIENHEIRQCKMPVALPNAQLENCPIITRRGIFELPERRGIFQLAEGVSTEGGLRLLRYAPDLSQAESLVLNGIAVERRMFSSTANLGTIAASEDGQWLLVEVNPH